MGMGAWGWEHGVRNTGAGAIIQFIGDFGHEQVFYSYEQGDVSVGMGAIFLAIFKKSIFCSSNDLISHIHMEAWEGE